jgi:CO/xanthine dehydrogenase FAD-binding subunit
MDEAYRPVSLDQALDMLDKERAVPLAGGTDLMVRNRSWSGLAPRFERPVVFTGHLEELQEIRREGNFLSIGASATLSSILDDGNVPPLLRRAVASIAGPGIRNRATIGGNICNASPAADSLPALYVLNAEVVLSSLLGTRELPIGEFIRGPGETALEPGELLTAVRIPADRPPINFFKKVGTRAAYSCAKLSIAGTAAAAGGKAHDVRLALGAVAPAVVRFAEVENLMEGKKAAEIRALLSRILGLYNAVLDPIDDQRSTAAYRRKAAFRLILYFIEAVLIPGIDGSASR